MNGDKYFTIVALSHDVEVMKKDAGGWDWKTTMVVCNHTMAGTGTISKMYGARCMLSAAADMSVADE